jgi:hypothetical protein
MHEGLGHTTHEEADENIPNEVKHVFPSSFCDLEINPAIAKLPIRSHAKEMTNDKCRITKEARMNKWLTSKSPRCFSVIRYFVIRSTFVIRISSFSSLGASRRRILSLLSDGG